MPATLSPGALSETEEDVRETGVTLDDLDRRQKEQDIEARKKYVSRIYRLVVSWLAAVIGVVLLEGQGEAPWLVPFSLDTAVLVALVTSATATVVGILLVVVRYLFPTVK